MRTCSHPRARPDPQLSAAGLPVTESEAGSRVTPAGAALSWQVFGLEGGFEEAPFFIVWSADSPHPSTTSPAGCTLLQWQVAGPNHALLAKLRDSLGLRVQTVEASETSFRLFLSCPKGPVEFVSAPRQP